MSPFLSPCVHSGSITAEVKLIGVVLTVDCSHYINNAAVSVMSRRQMDAVLRVVHKTATPSLTSGGAL